MSDLSDAVRTRMAETEKLNGALSGLFSEKPEEARELLRSLAAKWDEEEGESANTIRLYSGMASSLSEEDFRWCGASLMDRKKLRKDRLTQYKRFCELFELEIAATLKARRLTMAQSSNWAGMERYYLDVLLMTKAKIVLRCAGCMFRFRIPGSVDVCDWAAWKLYENAYCAF